jgi:transcriptional regulator with XRE-family HTH domain
VTEDPYMNEFARRLYDLRQLKGQSARNMSLFLGQSHNYMNGIESKRNYPSMQMFFYICEHLGVTPQEFFDYGNANPNLDHELINEIKKLDYKSQEYFLSFVKEINKPRYK